MRLKSLLLGTSLLALVPVLAYAEDRLQPRAEVGVKAGSERSVLTTEFWAPLAQKSDRVVYTDVRLMGDDDSNREGNLGFGYRQIYAPTNSVLGVHGWIDRRRTEHGNNFHEITIGAESLGSSIDLRANGYIALDGAKTAITPNLGPTTPYLAGTGLFYNTNGSITETPQHGVDAEAGYRLPLFEKHVDTVRVYGGGYHFFRSGTDNLTGIRLRTEAQINPALSVGARFQHDGPRGSQGFLEATLKSPFSAKKMFQKSGLRARLDESPERDIDIVTGAKVDNGQRQIQNSTTGDAQRILYVDNTNTNTGDGSYENPFNTLKAAEAALKANDILYVRSGNGTTTGMDQGINIIQSGVSLIGSGSALTVGGITFLNAGAAPTITNTQTAIDNGIDPFSGDGVFITGANATISGLTITNAQSHGIYAFLQDASHWNSFTATNNTITDSVNSHGVEVKLYSGNCCGGNSFYGGTIDNVSIRNNMVSNSKLNNINFSLTTSVNGVSNIGNIIVDSNITNSSTAIGINLSANSTSKIDNAIISNNTASGNTVDGIRVYSNSGSTIDNLAITGNNSSSNISNANGLNIQAQTNSRINTIDIANNNFSANTQQGLYLSSQNNSMIGTVNYNNNISNNNASIYTSVTFVAQANGFIDTINAHNNTSSGNAGQGIAITSEGTGSRINQSLIDNSVVSNNGNRGIFFYAVNGGTINSASATNITANNNASQGVFFQLGSQGTMGSITVNTVNAFNNAQNGVYALVQNSVVGNASISNVIADNNAQNGVYIQSNTSTIGNVSLTNIIANNNSQNGAYIYTQSGTISQINLSNSLLLNNTVNGAYIQSQSGTITQATINNINASGNKNRGINLLATGGSSMIANSVISNSTVNNNLNAGIFSQASGATSVLGSVTVSGITANSNSQQGIVGLASGGGRIITSTISGNIVNSNLANGIQFLSQNSGSIVDSIIVSGNTTNSNVSNGIMVQSFSSGTITNTAITNNTSNSNTGGSGNGIQLIANGTAYIAGATISGNTTIGNSANGLLVYGDVNSIISASVFNNNSTGNTGNGIFVNRVSTPTTFIVDLGGGSLVSIGGNRIFNNAGTEVRIDGGYALQAQNNYWGGGDLAGGERTLNGGSTITTTGFLVTDPRP